jgi:hypothetical protein
MMLPEGKLGEVVRESFFVSLLFDAQLDHEELDGTPPPFLLFTILVLLQIRILTLTLIPSIL